MWTESKGFSMYIFLIMASLKRVKCQNRNDISCIHTHTHTCRHICTDTHIYACFFFFYTILLHLLLPFQVSSSLVIFININSQRSCTHDISLQDSERFEFFFFQFLCILQIFVFVFSLFLLLVSNAFYNFIF